jgi:hypothetical protein
MSEDTTEKPEIDFTPDCDVQLPETEALAKVVYVFGVFLHSSRLSDPFIVPRCRTYSKGNFTRH